MGWFFESKQEKALRLAKIAKDEKAIRRAERDIDALKQQDVKSKARQAERDKHAQQLVDRQRLAASAEYARIKAALQARNKK